MRIRIHYREAQAGPFSSVSAEVKQVPEVGEFVAPAPLTVYRVVLTLHVLFAADYDAEVFAELVDFEAAQTQALGQVIWKGETAQLRSDR
jgi:hypothetical protein